jgi:cytochrome c-type biogenesis protein CcmH
MIATALPDWLVPFLTLATLLAALFGASLAWAGGPGGTTRRVLPVALGAPLVLVALYAALGHPRALDPLQREPGATEQVEAMVQRLAERLQRDPGDRDGWLMLARSYKVMARYDEAAAAYEQAGSRALDDPDLLADWIEARILATDRRFDTRSRELLARAMTLAPQHPGVLMMRGLAALDRGDRPAARAAFAQLRGLYPDGSADRQALDQALARLDAGEDPRARAAPPDTDAAR